MSRDLTLLSDVKIEELSNSILINGITYVYSYIVCDGVEYRNINVNRYLDNFINKAVSSGEKVSLILIDKGDGHKGLTAIKMGNGEEKVDDIIERREDGKYMSFISSFLISFVAALMIATVTGTVIAIVINSVPFVSFLDNYVYGIILLSLVVLFFYSWVKLYEIRKKVVFTETRKMIDFSSWNNK